MEPLLKYPGGKSKEIPLVNRYKPTNIERYFEPFVGGGSIYFDIDIRESFINDFSSDLYQLYLFIKQQNQEFKNYLLLLDQLWKNIEGAVSIDTFNNTGYSYSSYLAYYKSSLKRKKTSLKKLAEKGAKISKEDKKLTEMTARKTAVYMLVRERYNSHPALIERVGCFYFLREYCYSSMFRFSAKGDFNVPYGGRSYDKKYMSKKIDRMFSNETQRYMENTIVSNQDFESFLNDYQLTNNDFIFLDPPYDSDFSTYDNNPFDKAEQIRLRDFLSHTQAKWMLIIKKTDFIYDLYKNFYIFTYDMNYMVSFKNRNDKDVKHLLITNYGLE